MQITHCPICYEELTVQDVTPCMDCGLHYVDQVESGQRTYAEYSIFSGLKLVLCNICVLDFMSYKPTYFGLPNSARINIKNFNYIRPISPTVTTNKCCLECGFGLPFLNFVIAARELHSKLEG